MTFIYSTKFRYLSDKSVCNKSNPMLFLFRKEHFIILTIGRLEDDSAGVGSTVQSSKTINAIGICQEDGIYVPASPPLNQDVLDLVEVQMEPADIINHGGAVTGKAE